MTDAQSSLIVAPQRRIFLQQVVWLVAIAAVGLYDAWSSTVALAVFGVGVVIAVFTEVRGRPLRARPERELPSDCIVEGFLRSGFRMLGGFTVLAMGVVVGFASVHFALVGGLAGGCAAGYLGFAAAYVPAFVRLEERGGWRAFRELPRTWLLLYGGTRGGAYFVRQGITPHSQSTVSPR